MAALHTNSLSLAQNAVLSRWASVSRTLRAARGYVIEHAIKGDDDAQACLEELDQLIIPLDRLHQAYRDCLWRAEEHADETL